MQDEYVEILEVCESIKVEIKERVIPLFDRLHEGDDDFEKRMENWKRVVRGSLGGGGGGGFCAGWARLYVHARDENERTKLLKRFGELPVVESQRTRVSVDELDGWLVEAAVRSLPDFDQRKVLQYWYVWQHPEHWIKTKLMLRRSGVRLVLGRAQNNLKNILRGINSAAIIHSNNLHAGVDPRPESKDVPIGDALTL